MSNIILFNKPFGVLSQFTGAEPDQTLSPYLPQKNVYAAGRLDKDSEGLLVLTDDGKLQNRIANPRYKKTKVYLAQLEGEIHEGALRQLAEGVDLKDGRTLPAKVKAIPEPELWPRKPPVRFRKNIPTCWIEISLREGRNRQVRRMTAATGFPTLRLVRIQVGEWKLEDLAPGSWRALTVQGVSNQVK